MVNFNPPAWFVGIDSVIELFAMIVCVLLVLFSFKAKRYTKNKVFLYFGIAYGLIGLGFLFKSVSNVLIYTNVLHANSNLLQIFNLGFVFYLLATLVGYLILTFIFLKIRSKKVVALISILVLYLAIFSKYYLGIFNLLATFLLFFVSLSVWQNHFEKRKESSKAVVIGFSLLFFSHLLFIVYQTYFNITTGKLVQPNSVFYAISESLQLLAYLALLITIIRVTKK